MPGDDDRMKFGYSTLACPDWTLEQAFNRGAEYGYEGLEIQFVDGRFVTPRLLKENLRRIRNLSESSGCRLFAIGTLVQLAQEGVTERTKALSEAQAFIELSGQLGVEFVRVFGGWTVVNRPDEWTIDVVSEGLGRLTELAAKFNVKLALETHDCFSNTGLLRRVLEKVDSPQGVALGDLPKGGVDCVRP